MNHLHSRFALLLAALLLCTSALALAEDDYLYGYTSMSFADFWYGELEAPAPCDTFDLDAPDLTAQSEAYLRYASSSPDDPDRFAGVQKNTWDNDSGMYDAISRATVGYGIFRAGFAHDVELTLDDGSTVLYQSEIVEDATSPTGYTLRVNTGDVPGIVLSANTRLDTENTTGYTPNTKTTYAQSIQTGGGYRILGLRSVPVKVKKSTVEAAKALTEAGTTNAQLEAFNAQLAKITFVDSLSSYACKELYANGIYGARERNMSATTRTPGAAYLGDGTNSTKPIAHGDGYADLTMFVYLDAYEGYTRGSLASLDEAALDTLYAEEEKPTYAANKEAADKLAGFMHYALNYQGAKLQWAGEDGAFDTADDVFAGNIGEGILVQRALQLAQAGLDAAQIAQRLDEEKKAVRLIALLDTLEYLKRGGRLSKSAAVVGGLLSIKPVVAVKGGEVVVLGKARGSKNGNNLLVEEIKRTNGIDFTRPYLLGYTGLNDTLLQKYIADSSVLWQGHAETLPVNTIGGTIGTHVGPGAIAVAFFCNVKK